MKITGWGPGSQSVKLILLLTEISTAYAEIPFRTCQRKGFFEFFEAHFPRRKHLKNQSLGLRIARMTSWGQSANGCQGESLRTLVFVPGFRLFTIAQVPVPSTAIVIIGFSATVAAMSLGE
jgi:hypothetical protein